MSNVRKASSASEPNRPRALRIHGTIARDIGIRIVSGRYRPGDTLSGEVAAADELNVSRTAYREAVRILSAKGLVESRPKTGTRISEQSKWHLLDPDILSWIFEHEPDDALVASLFELRKIVEPQAALFAAERRSDAQIERMARALDGMAEHTLTTEAGRMADQDFHATLLEAAANPFLTTLTSGVGAAVSWTTLFKQRHNPLPRDPLPDHRAVFDAVAAGDAEGAHQAMADLVDMAFADTKEARKPGR